jgi:uncharacterized protein YoxC
VPIKIALVEDVSSVIKGSQDVAKSFDDVADSLDDLARDAQRAGKSTGTEFKRGTDDARDGVEKLERSFKDMTDAVKPASKKVGDDIGDSVKDGTHKASESTEEFKDEARSNFSEVASSFSGDMDSAADLVQGTLGGLAGSLTGPIGLALGGLGAAAGLFYNQWKENSEKTKQTISDMYDDMLASGADFLSKDYIADQLSKIYQGADDAAIKVKALRELATESEIPEPLLARALVGDEQARAKVKSEIAARRLDINEALDDATAKGQNIAPVLAPAIQALQDVEDKVNGTSKEFTEAQRNAEAAGAAIAGITAPTQGVASSAEDARSKFDGLGRAISGLPSPTVKVTADLTEARRQIKQLTDGSYSVTINGKATGVRYY